MKVRRRDFITLLGGAAAAWPVAARAQQGALPVIAFVSGRSADGSTSARTALSKGLAESGVLEDQNVTVESHWLDGQYGRLSALMADLVRRRVAAIVAQPSVVAVAAKTATTAVPIVFAVQDDPVRLGLAASLAHPGGNATGINILGGEIVARRLGLLHELVPKAVRIGVLVNPVNVDITESTLRESSAAAPTLGLEIMVFKASTTREIEEAFARMERERAEALFIAADSFFGSHRVQLVILSASHRIPAVYAGRDVVEAGGLMNYGANTVETYRQMGIYAGRILKGAKPADLPVVQSAKFELVINLQTARAIGLVVSPDLLSIADEVIE
jgi:putative ABC transport system substrate-binding protein